MTDMRHVQNPAARATTVRPRPTAIESMVWASSDLRSRVYAAVFTPDFVAVTVFCAIGLLATLDLMLAVPGIALK